MSFLTKILSNLGFRNQKSVDGRLRVSPQISLGDYKQYLNNAAGQFETYEGGVSGTATYEGDAIGGTALTTSADADVVVRQSYQWHNYFAGKPQKIELTASKFGEQTNVTKRMGYFSSGTSAPYNSDLDGFFFESTGTGTYCKIVRDGTEVFSLEQANWNNQGDLSNYDPNDFNFYVIEFLYLGGAVCNFWVLTEFGLTKVASYQHINVDQNTFVKSPNQPVRYEIRQSGAGSGLFNQICADVATEGQQSAVGALRCYDTNTTGLSGMNTGQRYALLGVRHASGSKNILFNFKTLSILSTTNDDLLVEVIFGGSVAGTAPWTSIAFTNAEGFVGDDIAGGESNKFHSGGVKILSYYLEGNGSFSPNVDTSRKLGMFLDGTSEELYVCVTPITNNGAAYGSISWIEFI